MTAETHALPKRRVFVDMDGVVVDFDAYKTERGLTGDEVKARAGAYLDMPAIPGAIEAVRSVIGMGYEVWMATKPPTGVPHAYSDKAAWVMKHLPELKRRIIITHDKGLLGGTNDFLCDDRPHKANCEAFAGTLLRFVDGYHWPQALDDLRAAKSVSADYPECSGDPACCPENEGFGCCKPNPEPSASVSDEGTALFKRACEVVHHDADCPAIDGNGDSDCTCDAVPFLNYLESFAKRSAAAKGGGNG